MEARGGIRSELSHEQARAVCGLWNEVWSLEVEGSLDEQATRFLADRLPEQRMEAGSERFHWVEDAEGRILAVARSFVRKIRFDGQGALEPVLALAGVCSSPASRGRGLGRRVVLDAFDRLSPEVPWSLFQTGVPEFYERLGGYRVGNEFRDSYAQDAAARPWWDEHVMVVGRSRKWPEGRVDLCGVAY